MRFDDLEPQGGNTLATHRSSWRDPGFGGGSRGSEKLTGKFPEEIG